MTADTNVNPCPGPAPPSTAHDAAPHPDCPECGDPGLIEMVCPRCRHEETDHDGFGMLACDECGWCSHPDRYDGECLICGDTEDTT